jgi:hypothetical protein
MASHEDNPNSKRITLDTTEWHLCLQEHIRRVSRCHNVDVKRATTYLSFRNDWDVRTMAIVGTNQS